MIILVLYDNNTNDNTNNNDITIYNDNDNDNNNNNNNSMLSRQSLVAPAKRRMPSDRYITVVMQIYY